MTTNAVEQPKVVSREEWLAARKELLAKEKELARQRDAISLATESSFLQPARCLNNVFPSGYGTIKISPERSSSPARSTYKWRRTTRPAYSSAETKVPAVW